MIKEAARGSKAKAILENEIFQDAWAKVEEGIIERWKEAPMRDLEGQQALKMMLKLMSDVRAQIEEVMTTGKMAEASLEHERTIAERAKAAIREFKR